MENQNMENQVFKIYLVPSYKSVVYEKTETTPDYCSVAQSFMSKDIKKIVKELKNDKQYHQVLFKNDVLKFNIDIDGLPKNMYEDLEQRIFNEISALDENLEFELAYTRNENGKKNIETKTKDYIYSHITLTGICATSSQQKIFWSNFVNKYPEYEGFCDFGHLGCAKKWYRLPNQTKEQKPNTEHYIKAGEMRDFILHDLEGCVNIDDKIINIEKEGKKKMKKEGKEELKEYENIPISENDKKLVELLNPELFYKYEDWNKMCWIFKSAGLSFELFDELSKKHDKLGKYNRNDNLLKWNNQKVSKINIGLIHHLVKKSNPEKYKELGLNYILKQDEEKTDIIKFSERYLLPKETVKISNQNDLLQKNIINFFNSDEYKSLSLKSPYGTGKTQMIKKIIDTFECKKILWLTYRKTLTNNIIGGEKFGKEYGFKSYQENKFDAERLIIQLESIQKLSYNMDFVDDEHCEYPSYDLVIIDEVESILAQFNSPTFKGASKECFDFVQNIIINSNKMLVLDGDISNRTYKFIDNFGKSINLVNDIKINKRTFKITEDRNKFIETIDADLDKNKKVVIVSMASTQCDTFSNRLTEKYPKKKILSYTGSSSDSTKKDFNNVDEIWAEADVLIYSPTCEAGVNFDKKHFDKMYGIFTDKSTTPRGLLQMFARIRQINETEIMILNDGVFSNHEVNISQYFVFEEVKNSIMALEGIQMKTENILINGKMCKSTKLSAYDVNYIYNRVEQLNSGSYYFLAYLEMMCLKKGHEFIKLNDAPEKDENGKKPEALDKENKVSKIDVILSTPDITKEEYEQALENQKKDNADEEEKNKVNRYVYKKALGIDFLVDGEEDDGVIITGKKFIQTFDVNSINNFVSLIDTSNIKDYTDNQTKEYKDKAELINKLIVDLGFNNIFDTKQILKTDFETKMNEVLKNNVLFTNQQNTQIRFNLNKTKKIDSVKGFLGFVNTLFESYNIKLSYGRIRVKGQKEKVACYNLEILNDINELLEYKIRKGFKFVDTQNIRTKPKTETYKHLIDWDKLKQQEEERAKRQKEREEELNKYAFGEINPLDML